MTLQEQLEIIQAAIDGKEIEILNPITKTWRNVPEQHSNYTLICNFGLNAYRIKPEPKKEIKLHQYLIKNLSTNCYITSQGLYPDLNSCLFDYRQHTDFKVIKVLPHTEITVTED